MLHSRRVCLRGDDARHDDADPAVLIYQQDFGFSEFMVTVIFATYAGGVIGALLLFGRLSDQVGRRRALLPGLALSGLSAVSFLLAHGLAPLLLGRVLSGLSAGIFTGTATAALVDLAGPEGRARASLVATMIFAALVAVLAVAAVALLAAAKSATSAP
jgi:MFS family permease